jgi:hypothetical protein
LRDKRSHRLLLWGELGVAACSPHHVQAAGLEFPLAALHVGVRAEGEVDVSRGADDRVGIAAFTRSAQCLAVGEVHPRQVVAQRHVDQQLQRFIESLSGRCQVASNA